MCMQRGVSTRSRIVCENQKSLPGATEDTCSGNPTVTIIQEWISGFWKAVAPATFARWPAPSPLSATPGSQRTPPFYRGQHRNPAPSHITVVITLSQRDMKSDRWLSRVWHHILNPNKQIGRVKLQGQGPKSFVWPRKSCSVTVMTNAEHRPWANTSVKVALHSLGVTVRPGHPHQDTDCWQAHAHPLEKRK